MLSNSTGTDVFVLPAVNQAFGMLDTAINRADTSEKLQIFDQIDLYHKAKLHQFAHAHDPPSPYVTLPPDFIHPGDRTSTPSSSTSASTWMSFTPRSSIYSGTSSDTDVATVDLDFAHGPQRLHFPENVTAQNATPDDLEDICWENDIFG